LHGAGLWQVPRDVSFCRSRDGWLGSLY
jgi:hypothetical protein